MSSELIDPGFRSRLERLIGEESPFGWAAKAGIPKATFSRIWNEGAPPKADHLRAIAGYSGVNLNWLLTGEGEMLLSVAHGYGEPLKKDHVVNDHSFTSGSGAHEGDFEFIPQYDVEVEAGAGAFNGREKIVGRLAFRKDWLKENALDAQKLAIVKVSGDSMIPTLAGGDMVLLDLRTSKARENAIYAIEVSGHIRIKRLQPKIDGSIIVQSDNPTYAPEQVPAAEADRLRVIGRAAWVGKVLK